ncbi:DNA-binding response regulator, OmpR family, contains REC and winged-helix (wHTH) domain [Pseudomonas marincola]|nr:DNA-binding response regulator, OmpR family, contains REC and winged-helix (wHTH) domain [Pseudomonas marincola]
MMMATPRVLIVDDDPVIREMLKAYLERDGYEVLCAETAEEAETILEQQMIDLLMLDIRLPGKDGLTLTRELRARSEVGIILITGSDDAVDRIVGLEMGADDYVVKPFNPRELVPRAKNLVRRVRHAQSLESGAAGSEEGRQIKYFGDWALDIDRRRLIDAEGHENLLTHGEFQLLSALLRNAGQTLSRDQLMDQVRNREWVPNDRSIDVLVGRLRRKLRDDPADPQLIITIHGAGYLFSSDVSSRQ